VSSAHFNPVLVDGRITQLAVFGYDMTDIDQGVEALRQSEQWLRESQRSLISATTSIAIDTDHWDCSPALADVFGISRSTTETSRVARAQSPDEREKLSRYFHRGSARPAAPFDLEYRVVGRLTARRRIVHGLGTVEWDPEGQPLQMFGVIQDIHGARACRGGVSSQRAALPPAFEQVPVALVLLR